MDDGVSPVHLNIITVGAHSLWVHSWGTLTAHLEQMARWAAMARCSQRDNGTLPHVRVLWHCALDESFCSAFAPGYSCPHPVPLQLSLRHLCSCKANPSFPGGAGAKNPLLQGWPWQHLLLPLCWACLSKCSLRALVNHAGTFQCSPLFVARCHGVKDSDNSFCGGEIPRKIWHLQT